LLLHRLLHGLLTSPDLIQCHVPSLRSRLTALSNGRHLHLAAFLSASTTAFIPIGDLVENGILQSISTRRSLHELLLIPGEIGNVVEGVLRSLGKSRNQFSVLPLLITERRYTVNAIGLFLSIDDGSRVNRLRWFR